MNKSRLFGAVCVIAIGFLCASGAHAAIITEFTDLATYNAAVGSHATIDFNDGFSEGTIITNQYTGQGVTFTDGDDFIRFDIETYLTDGFGLGGNYEHPHIGPIDITFSSPITHIGAVFPGALQIELYLGSTLVDTSSQFARSGPDHFGGIISTPFDRAVLTDWHNDTVFIDNLHFSTTVPLPAVAWLFGSGLLGLIGVARRRES